MTSLPQEETPQGDPTLISACEDCGLPYEQFPLDTVLPDADWLIIHPSGEGGLLCAGCIAKRAAALSTTIVLYARLVSGDDHTAFTTVKNVPLKALQEAAEASLTASTARVQELERENVVLRGAIRAARRDVGKEINCRVANQDRLRKALDANETAEAKVQELEADASWRHEWHTRLGRGPAEPEGKFYGRIEELEAENVTLRKRITRLKDANQP